MNVPVFLLLAQVQRQSYRSSYSDSYSSAKTRAPEKKVVHPHPTENRSQDIPPVDNKMAAHKEAAFYAAMMRNTGKWVPK